MKHEWTTSIPNEVHLAQWYEMRDGSAYLLITRKLFLQPSFPVAVYHFENVHEVEPYLDEYQNMLESGCVMLDRYVARGIMDVSNGIVRPDVDLKMCLWQFGEIVADGNIMGSRAMVAGGRYARTDTGEWFPLEEGRG